MSYATVTVIPIEELELGVRAYNILKRHGIFTFGDLINVTIEDANQWARENGHYLGLPAAKQIIEAQCYIHECYYRCQH